MGFPEFRNSLIVMLSQRRLYRKERQAVTTVGARVCVCELKCAMCLCTSVCIRYTHKPVEHSVEWNLIYYSITV